MADSVLWFARTREPKTDLAMGNGGGIRSSIPAPQITGFTVATALAFDNPHVIVEITAAGLLAALENGVSRLPASDGRFPQLAGAYLEYDPGRPGVSDRPTLTAPSRVRTLPRPAGGRRRGHRRRELHADGDPTRRFTLAANDFLVGGGDGYQALKAAAEAPGARKIAIPETEQQVLIAYVDRVLGRRVDVPDPVRPPRIVRVGG